MSDFSFVIDEGQRIGYVYVMHGSYYRTAQLAPWIIHRDCFLSPYKLSSNSKVIEKVIHELIKAYDYIQIKEDNNAANGVGKISLDEFRNARKKRMRIYVNSSLEEIESARDQMIIKNPYTGKVTIDNEKKADYKRFLENNISKVELEVFNSKENIWELYKPFVNNKVNILQNGQPAEDNESPRSSRFKCGFCC